MNESIDTYTEELTCECWHTQEYTFKYDNQTGQTDCINPECSECGRDIREV
jgi:hypothetical protein